MWHRVAVRMWHFRMDDSTPSLWRMSTLSLRLAHRHPLQVAGTDCASMSCKVLMLEHALSRHETRAASMLLSHIDHISDSFEPAMRMVGKALAKHDAHVARDTTPYGRERHAELVEHQKWVEILQFRTSDAAADTSAGPLALLA